MYDCCVRVIKVYDCCVRVRRAYDYCVELVTSHLMEERELEETPDVTSRGQKAGRKREATTQQMEEDDYDEDDHGHKRHTKSQLEVKVLSFKTFWYIVRLGSYSLYLLHVSTSSCLTIPCRLVTLLSAQNSTF